MLIIAKESKLSRLTKAHHFYSLSFIFFLFLGIFLFSAQAVLAATIYANYTSGNDTTGDGSSGSPYKTFHKAYTMAASSGDTLNLTGTFTWTNADETGDAQTTGYTIAKSLTIQGQSASETIIQAATSYASGDRTVLTVSSGYTVTINDVTVRYGYNRTGDSGGGINNNGTLTVNRCNISYNYVWYYPSWGGYGGGIRNGSILYVNDSTVNNNFAQSQGGGIVNAYTASNNNVSYITNTTIAFNSTADVVATVGGAGIFIRSGTVYVTNCTIAYNVAPEGTGDTTGIDVEDPSAHLYVKNSIVAHNKVTVSGVDHDVNYASGNFFDLTAYGNIHDNGGNVFGKVNTAYNGVSIAATTWYDLYSNSAGDNIYTLYGSSATGTLPLDTSLAGNGTMYGNQTLAITSGSSVSVNNGLASANGSISIPGNDSRGASRNSTTDIGAYEYDGGLTVSAPTVQAYNLSFSSVTYNRFTLGWTNGDGAKRIVFVKQADTGTTTPADLTAYTANTVFGSGSQIGSSGWYAVYNDTGTSVTVTGLSPSTNYIAQIFEYNGTSGYQKYFNDAAVDNPKVQSTVALLAPTSQAHTVAFSSISNSQLTVSWSSGNGENRVVFMKAANTGTASPVDTTTYTASTVFGSGTQIASSGWYCIYNGTGTSVAVTGLSSETDYIVQVFEYNGGSGSQLYFSDTASSNPNTSATTAIPSDITLGTGTSVNGVTEASPINIWYQSLHGQSVYTAAELNAAGANGQITITGVGFYINSAPIRALPNFVIRMKHTSDTNVANWQSSTGMITAYSTASYAPTAGGFQTLTLSNPFVWNGTDNIVVDTAFSLVSYDQSGTTRYYSTTNGYRCARSDSSDQTNIFSGGSTSTYKPQIKFTLASSTVYTLTYTAGANGSITGVTPQLVSSGGSGSAVTPTPSTGYHFTSWSDASTANPRTDTSVVANLSVTASFAINTYTLSYAAGSNGSLTGSTSQTVNYGASGTAVTAVANANYHFTSWSDGSTANPRTDTNVSSNKSVTASFALDTRTLTYTAGANGSISGSASQTVNYGSSGSAVTAVASTGYHFTSWSDGSTANPRTDTNVTTNLSVTASFAINTFTLNYSAGANGSLTGSTSQTVNYGSSGSAVTAVPDTGFSFISWSDASTANPRTDTNVTANKSVTASFATSSVTLTYTAGAHGSISGVASQTVAYSGSGAAVTAVADTGYHFVNWSDASTANPRTDTNVTSNVSVTANFAIDTKTLTYTAGANGSITGSASQTVNYGSSGSAVTAVPDSGYTFSSWSDGSTTNPRTDSNVTTNKSVTASFVLEDGSIYVNSSTGNDTTGSGSSSAPYKTFYKAYTAASAGDTLDLTGTFTWSDPAEIGDTATSGYVIAKSLTIRGQGADATFVQAAASAYTADRRIFTINNNITVTLKNLTIRYGYLNADNANGSAIYSLGNLTILDSTITGNANPARYGGAAIYYGGSGLFAMRNSTIYDNGNITGTWKGYTAALQGGSSNAWNEITNCTFYNNKANYNGGLFILSGDLTITNSTFINNYGYSSSNDILAWNTAKIYLKNNIFAERQAASAPNISAGGNGQFVDGGYNLIEYQTSAGFANGTNGNIVGETANLNISTTLASNSNTNGVPTLALSAGSAAINAGDPANAAHHSIVIPVTDERYFSRSGTTDMGAYEYSGSATSNSTPTHATYVYVNSSTGNDLTGDGTQDAPYKTFYKGYLSTTSGGTMDLTGTFSWTDSDEIGDAPISGYTISKSITLQGHSADETIIEAASLDNTANRRVFTIFSGVTVVINDLAIRYGKLTDSTNDGGGIQNSGTLTINDCEIYNNRALGSYGGGVSNWNKLTLNRSTVYNNVANYMGGGLVNSYYVAAGGYLNITNSTIVYNQVTATTAYTEGGGVHYRKGSGTITNSTIAYNTACGAGGVGMDDQNGTLTIRNSILAKNIRLNHSYCSNGSAPVDFDFRQAGYGNVVDNGNNIVGYSYRYTWTGSNDWVGASSWSGALAWDKETFTLYGSATTGGLKISPSLAINSNASSTQTLALLADSIAINRGATGSNGSISVPSTDQRGVARSGSTDIGSYEYGGAPADTTAPTISSVSVTASTTTATISWSTNEESSSQVRYDPNTYLTTRTPVYNSAVKTIGHEVSLSNLVPCSRYYYQVISQDDAGNIAASDTAYFMTTGCAGSATASEVSVLAFVPSTTNGAEVNGTSSATDSDYTLTQTVGNLTFSLVVPRTFTESLASLQVKSLDASTALNSLSKPSGYNNGGSTVFDLKALSDPASTISSFDSAATVSVTYSDSDVSGLDESTLQIYRNDGSDWSALSNCYVDTSANVVTCSTTNFSTFGIFGQAASTGSSSTGGGGYTPPSSLGSGSIDKTIAMDTTQNIGELSKDGVNILAYVNSIIVFEAQKSTTLKKESYQLKITDVSIATKKIKIELSVGSKVIELAVGQSWGLDFDGDKIDDITLTYNNLLVNRVDLTIKQLEFTQITQSAENTKIQKTQFNTGDLVKEPGKPAVYLIQDNTKRPFFSAQAFLTNGYQWSAIQIINTLSSYPTGEMIYTSSTQQPTIASTYQFTRDLELGMQGEDVRELQKYLNNHGFTLTTTGPGSPNHETTLFGRLTQAALIKFQQANHIQPAVGYFGTISRKSIN